MSLPNDSALSPYIETIMQQFVDAARTGDQRALLRIADSYGDVLKDVGNNFHYSPPPSDGSGRIPAGMVAMVQLTSPPPLHIAAFHGFTDVAQKLMDRGCDPNELNLSGQTAATVAEEKGHPETAKAISTPKNTAGSGPGFNSLKELYASMQADEKDYVDAWVAKKLKAGDILTIKDGYDDVKQGRMPRDGYQIWRTMADGNIKGQWMETAEFVQFAAVQPRDAADPASFKKDLPEGTEITPVERGSSAINTSRTGIRYETTANSVDGVQLKIPGDRYEYLSGLAFNAIYNKPGETGSGADEVIFCDRREEPSKGVLLKEATTVGDRKIEAGSMLFVAPSRPEGFVVVEPDIAKRFAMEKPDERSPQQHAPEIKNQSSLKR